MKTLFIILSALIGFNAQAQHGGDPAKKEQMEALRVSFITQKVELTRDEAQKFWPVYNEYRGVIDSLRDSRREQFKKYRDGFDALSEKELNDYVDNQIIYRQRELDAMKKYHAEFKGLLPLKKVALLYKAEEEFKAKVIKEMHNRAD